MTQSEAIEDIRARRALIPKWQRSHYVRHPKYREMSQSWHEQAAEIESLTIRGPGAVGTPECNTMFRVAGASWDFEDNREAVMDFIAHAPEDIDTLLRSIEWHKQKLRQRRAPGWRWRLIKEALFG